ncbi:MAG: hypothetical protein PHQ72_02360 [Hespellia sp.]|nr:hypothetical protein [Hespellia sp.]
MEHNTLKEKMIEFFEKTLDLTKSFQKKTYQNQINAAYDEYQEMYQMLQEKLENSEEAIEEISSYIPEYAAEAMKDMPKRKQQLQKIDNNMAMVSFFVPLMGKVRSDKAEHFTDQLVQSWNEMFPDAKIGKSNVEQIQGGFKKGLCYITTAVCESLGKEDDCYELTLLRDYRDRYLMETTEGVDVVKEYYNIAPTIVNRIGKEDNSKEIYQNIWVEYLQPCVKLIEQEQMEECQETYSKMMYELEGKYLYS